MQEQEIKRIVLESTKDTRRHTLLMSDAVFDRYKARLGGINGASAFVDYAITRLMDEIDAGIIEPKLKL